MERSPRASTEKLRMSLRLRLEARRVPSSRRADSDPQSRHRSELGVQEMEARPRDA
jgi:hypothetical protein